MRHLITLFLLFLYLGSVAQEKCGFTKYQELNKKRYPQLLDNSEFERWLNGKMDGQSARVYQYRVEPYKIPVVIHIVHRADDALNSGSNIPESQAVEQIRILNEDFRKLNTAQINSLPEEFKPLASDTQIEFVLAKQDPEGLPTTGINRLAATKSSYNMDDDLEIKKLVHWPSNRYLNMYVAPLSNGLLGYAQFPESDILAGLEDEALEIVDGVVIDYRFFGIGGNTQSDNLGRTTTHEVGHYFGLRHIWGDGACNKDDYVSDTPNVSGSHAKCPENNNIYKNCEGGPAMYQNYMDYTEDKCMALFTHGQSNRMQVVLENSPRRKELPKSPSLNEPVRHANDAGIRSLYISDIDLCTGSLSPTLEVRNYGSNQINQIKIELLIDNVTILGISPTINLDYPDILKISLSNVATISTGKHILTANITQVNNTGDGYATNNTISYEFISPMEVELPYIQAFERDDFEDFVITNPDNFIGWEVVPVARGANENNKAVFINFNDYNAGPAKDYLTSPIFKLDPNAEGAFANFDIAYAPYSNSTYDRLNVYAITECNAPPESGTLIYSKTGQELATSPATTDDYVPTTENEWRTEFIDLSKFVGYEKIQLIFETVNGYGNNLYVDNVRVTDETEGISDIILQSVVTPSPVNMDTEGLIKLVVRNASATTVNSLQFSYSINGVIMSQFTKSGLLIEAGKTDTITFVNYAGLEPGSNYNFSFSVTNPNGIADLLSYNNNLTRLVTVNNNIDVIPSEQLFSEQPLSNQSPWVSAMESPEDTNWLSTHLASTEEQARSNTENFGAEAFFGQQSYANQAWLVSPTLNLTDNMEAGLKYYYAHNTSKATRATLAVIASRNGGRTYTDTLWQIANLQLGRQMDKEVPSSASDWNKVFISLEGYIGQDSLRIAFVGEANNQSRLFIDDIRFYGLNQEPTYTLPASGQMVLYPNPKSLGNSSEDLTVVFNFSTPKDLTLNIYDMQGKIIREKLWLQATNKPFYINTDGLSPGVYIVRILGDDYSKGGRMVISP